MGDWDMVTLTINLLPRWYVFNMYSVFCMHQSDLHAPLSISCIPNAAVVWVKNNMAQFEYRNNYSTNPHP